MSSTSALQQGLLAAGPSDGSGQRAATGLAGFCQGLKAKCAGLCQQGFCHGVKQKTAGIRESAAGLKEQAVGSLGDDPMKMVFVDVLNPRLQKFGKRSLPMGLMVVSIMIVSMISAMIYMHSVGVTKTTSLLSQNAAEAVDSSGGNDAVCATWTHLSFEAASSGLLSNWSQLNTYPKDAVKVSGDYGTSEQMLHTVDRLRSIWAPLLTLPAATLNRGKQCNGDGGASKSGAGYNAWSCGLWASKEGEVKAFSIYSDGTCELYGSTTICDEQDLVMKPGVDTYFFHAQEQEQEKVQVPFNGRNEGSLANGVLMDYPTMFQPLFTYGQSIGLEPPSLEDAVQKGDVTDYYGQKYFTPRFSTSMVDFTQKLYNLIKNTTSQTHKDFSLPCELQSTGCASYTCFNSDKVVCGEGLYCALGPGIVSLTHAKKTPWPAALIQVVGLSHNLEIASTALVVVLVLYGLMSEKEREDLSLSTSELASIIQVEKLKPTSEDLEEQLCESFTKKQAKQLATLLAKRV